MRKNNAHGRVIGLARRRVTLGVGLSSQSYFAMNVMNSAISMGHPRAYP